jgi:hypothetical protein
MPANRPEAFDVSAAVRETKDLGEDGQSPVQVSAYWLVQG